MSPHTVRLITLAEREFRNLTDKHPAPPRPQRFKAMRLRLDRFDASWGRKRLSAVRLAGLLLRDDDVALEALVCGNEQSTRTYTGGVALLQREAAYLRRASRMLETAAGRLSVVLERCQRTSGAPPS